MRNDFNESIVKKEERHGKEKLIFRHPTCCALDEILQKVFINLTSLQ